MVLGSRGPRAEPVAESLIRGETVQGCNRPNGVVSLGDGTPATREDPLQPGFQDVTLFLVGNREERVAGRYVEDTVFGDGRRVNRRSHIVFA